MERLPKTAGILPIKSKKIESVMQEKIEMGVAMGTPKI
jgi:hypothetical protein